MKRDLISTIAHAAGVGVLVHFQSWGLAAFGFCLFVYCAVKS